MSRPSSRAQRFRAIHIPLRRRQADIQTSRNNTCGYNFVLNTVPSYHRHIEFLSLYSMSICTVTSHASQLCTRTQTRITSIYIHLHAFDRSGSVSLPRPDRDVKTCSIVLTPGGMPSPPRGWRLDLRDICGDRNLSQYCWETIRSCGRRSASWR